MKFCGKRIRFSSILWQIPFVWLTEKMSKFDKEFTTSSKREILSQSRAWNSAKKWFFHIITYTLLFINNYWVEARDFGSFVTPPLVRIIRRCEIKSGHSPSPLWRHQWNLFPDSCLAIYLVAHSYALIIRCFHYLQRNFSHNCPMLIV